MGYFFERNASHRRLSLMLGCAGGDEIMCRSIKTLRRKDEPATDDEIHAAALQFVRKVSGYRQPSKANAEAFDAAGFAR
jgi:hypothetical protein